MLFSGVSGILLLAHTLPVTAYLVNSTIDDVLGHYAAQVRLWEARSGDDGCTECLAKPDPKQIHGGTWHDKTTFPGEASSNITFSFNGTAVYVFFILANRVSFTNTDTHLAFHLDGAASPAATFDHIHDPAVDGFLYNQLVFASGALPAGEHSVAIRCAAKGTSPSLALFDYAVYSYAWLLSRLILRGSANHREEVEETSLAGTGSSSPHSDSPNTAGPSTPSTGAARSVVGTAVGAAMGAAAGVVCLFAAALACCQWRVRRRKRASPVEAEAVPATTSDRASDLSSSRAVKASRLGIGLSDKPARGGGSVPVSEIPPLYAP